MTQVATGSVTGRRSEFGGERTVAFVFQGGGSLSAPQVGMLRALTEAGVTPDLVIGTSAGALNAVAYASDPTIAGLRRLERLWLSLRRRDVARISARTLLRAIAGRGDGLFDAAPLGQLLRTDVVAPVLDGRRLVDGGVSADIPVLQGEDLCARVSFVLPAAGADDRHGPLRGPLAIAYHALGQLLESSARRDSLAAQGEVHLLPPALSAASNPLDFRETARLIREGYELATGWLAGQAIRAGGPKPTSLA